MPGTAIVYSPDGSLLATWTASSVTVFQEDMTPLTSFEADNLITFMCFSPKSAFPSRATSKTQICSAALQAHCLIN